MAVSEDLAPETLTSAVPGRPVRTYPALVSTEADALAWARAGAPSGSVVVADYQVSPRGRFGLEWQVAPRRDLAFSVVLRPELSVEREGWLYTLATAALADVCGEDATIRWPDEVRRAAVRVAAVGIHVEHAPDGVAWAVANVLLPDVAPQRAATLARVLAALERRCASAPDAVLAEHRSRCETIGRRVCAELLPAGPNAPRVIGTAVTTRDDGALVIETHEGRRVAVRPQGLGLLEDV